MRKPNSRYLEPLKKLALLSLSVLTLSAVQIPLGCAQGDKPYSTQQLTLATYNIKNLFDGVQNPGKPPEKAKPEAELQALSQAMHTLNADVVAVQEVETQAVLESFRDRYLKDMNYQHVVLREGNDPRGIDVGILSRLPVLEVKTYKDLRFSVPELKHQTSFSRDLLQVKLQANAKYTFTLFVVHLKSKLGGKSAEFKRKAEARQIQQLLLQLQQSDPQANFAIVGDFNDTAQAPALSPLLKAGKAFQLHDLAGMELAPQAYSYHPKKHRSRIDYILVSPTMLPEYVKNSARIHTDEVYRAASDHLPLTAQFDVSADR